MNWAPVVGVAGARSRPWWWCRRVRAPRGSWSDTAIRRRLRACPTCWPWRWGSAVNAARGGASAWAHVFDLGPHGSFEASREYLPALADLGRGVGYYVSHFAALLPYLPTHVKGNPPGPVVAMHLLGITSAGRLAAACVGRRRARPHRSAMRSAGRSAASGGDGWRRC